MDNYSEPLTNGLIQVITVPDPSAGANWSHLFANNFTYEIISVRFRLVTDSTVTTRNVGLQLVEVSNILLELMYVIGQPASDSVDWNFYHGATVVNNLGRALGTGPLPPRFTIHGNFILRSSIFNMVAGDQLSNIDIYHRRWINQTV